MDMLETGAAWLEEKRLKHRVKPVVYKRGDTAVETVATIGKTVFQIDKGYGAFEKTESRDFLIGATALLLDESEGQI